MFACTSMNGMAMAVAVTDVCKTPSPAGPVPIPYPNIAMLNMANPGNVVKKVVVLGMPAFNVKTQTTLSNGDQLALIWELYPIRLWGHARLSLQVKKLNLEGSRLFL